MTDDQIRECPFCGQVPDFPKECYGTQYEVWCDCGMAQSCVQICDLMIMDERKEDIKISPVKYSQKYVDRARKEAIRQWNQRYDR